jgi:RNA polymerase sigma factor (sigma-70 family)
MSENEDFSLQTPFEPLYEKIKRNQTELWFDFQDRTDKLIKWLAWWKNFDKDELYQQSYLYFIQLCDQYDPYYDGKFFKFDRYLYKNLIIKLRAYIQRYYFKGKREKPSEYCEFLLKDQVVNDMNDVDDELYTEHIFSKIDPREAEIIRLTMKGYKQQEIGRKLDISQSRVSVIKKKAIKNLCNVLDDTHTDEEKREMMLNDLKKTFYK